MKEIWEDVKGYEGLYQVSNFGKLKSMEKFIKSKNGSKSLRKEKNMKLSLNRDGYYVTSLTKDGIKKNVRVHVLVANVFALNLENKPIVNHLDGIKNNNFYKNLQWSTLSENRQHAYDIGLQNPVKGERHPNSKLKIEDVKQIRKLKGIKKQKEIAKIFGISFQHVSDIQSMKKWKHIKER